MPIYEYVCSDCGLKFELLRKLNQASEAASCPSCHKTAERKLSSFACFSTDDSGMTSSIGGNSCASCSSGSCASCGL